MVHGQHTRSEATQGHTVPGRTRLDSALASGPAAGTRDCTEYLSPGDRRALAGQGMLRKRAHRLRRGGTAWGGQTVDKGPRR